MSKKSISIYSLILGSLLGISLLLSSCSDVGELNPPVYKTKLAADEIRNSAFKNEFPLQYATYEKNNETQVMTEYNGSVNYSKHNNVDPLPEGYKNAQP